MIAAQLSGALDLDRGGYDEGGAKYRDLPIADSSGRRRWLGYPADDAAYEDFIDTVLEAAAPRTGVAHGVIDFSNCEEESLVHMGLGGASAKTRGWVDPELRRVASVSREVKPYITLQDEPCHVSLRHRELSFVTRACSTHCADGAGIFWERVINPLCKMREPYDHLYAWLAIFFSFCREGRVAYYSRYQPGPQIRELARHARITLLPLPLSAIPFPQVRRHRRFRLMHLAKKQWLSLLERCDDPYFSHYYDPADTKDVHGSDT